MKTKDVKDCEASSPTAISAKPYKLRGVAPEDKARLIEEILFSIAHEGLSLRKACVKAGTSRPTFRAWVDADPLLASRYARAREELVEHWADQTMEIADTPQMGETRKITPNGKTVKTWNPTKNEWDITFEDLVETSQADMIAHRKLQIDTRKWLLSKIAPRTYGDKLEISGDADNPLTVALVETPMQVARRVAFALAKGLQEVQDVTPKPELDDDYDLA